MYKNSRFNGRGVKESGAQGRLGKLMHGDGGVARGSGDYTEQRD